MRAYLALCVAAALIGAARPECGACIEGACYRKHQLPGVTNYVMAIDRNNNILYSGDRRRLSQYQLDTGLGNTTNTWDVRHLTVDQRTSDVYGSIFDMGLNSLSKLNLGNNKAELLTRGDVYYVTYKDKPYYSSLNRGIYAYQNGESQVVVNTEEFEVNAFVVDKKGDIYFKNFVNTKQIIVRLSKGVIDHTVYWNGTYFLTTDRDGNAVFINENSHAVYRATDGQLTEIGVINDSIYRYDSLLTPLFDKDNNIIYGDDTPNYFHLKRDANVNCTYSISQNTTITETVVSTTP